MNALLAVSVCFRLLATGWAGYLFWRQRDWRLIFLPMMLGLLALQPMLPGLTEAHSLMLELSILAVVVATMFYLLLRHRLRRFATALLRVMLILVVTYQIGRLLSEQSFEAGALPHSELSLSLIVYLNIVLLGQILVERKEAEDRLRLQLKNDALHDALTGLPNRLLLMERLRLAYVRAKRRDDYLFAVMFVDLDRFKLVNDSLGHSIGDLLLIQAAKRIKEQLRGEDIVARMGGDEFAILIEDLKEPAAVERFARRLHSDLAEPYQLEGREIVVSASSGIAVNTLPYDRPEDLLRDADTAMYQAKAAGKGHSQMFDTHMHEQVIKQLQVEADLLQAVQGNQLEILYQPIVDLSTGRIVACEALVRWNHPTKGQIRPKDFISISEDTGQIMQIGEWVLRTACAQAKAWSEKGSAIRVSVNVSTLQLKQRRFIRTVADALEETGLAPDLLELELTESILLEDPEAASKTVGELSEMGIRIAIDDFGTGYSSLSYLRTLPLNNLKIDRAFVSGLTTGDSAGVGIVSTVILLARSLRLDVTAEGIESKEQLAYLRLMRCTRGQGYLFSVPAPAEAMEQMLGRSLIDESDESARSSQLRTLASELSDPAPTNVEVE